MAARAYRAVGGLRQAVEANERDNLHDQMYLVRYARWPGFDFTKAAMSVNGPKETGENPMHLRVTSSQICLP
jgi:hypothetical protein